MFKKGDLIEGTNCLFKYTNLDMKEGRVEETWIHPLNKKRYMDIRIIKHQDTSLNGKLYPAINCGEYFKIINMVK